MPKLKWTNYPHWYGIHRVANTKGVPYVQHSSIGKYIARMSYAAHVNGVGERYFDTLEDAKLYIETAVELGLETLIKRK